MLLTTQSILIIDTFFRKDSGFGTQENLGNILLGSMVNQMMGIHLRMRTVFTFEEEMTYGMIYHVLIKSLNQYAREPDIECAGCFYAYCAA